jgi:hypothetical protein
VPYDGNAEEEEDEEEEDEEEGAGAGGGGGTSRKGLTGPVLAVVLISIFCCTGACRACARGD